MSGNQLLAARREGDGIPVLIVHGWTTNGDVEAFDFEPIFSVELGYKRIYIDLPGMGKTAIGDGKDLDSMFLRLSSFIEKEILPLKFLVIGSSCGAYLARAVVYKYTSYVDGLLLRVPMVEPVSSERDLDPFKPIIADPKLMLSFLDDKDTTLQNSPIQTPQYLNLLRRKFQDVILPALDASNRENLAAIRADPLRYRLTFPMHSLSDPFTKPTLIITGRQDITVGYRDSWKLMPSYPRATYIAMDRGDHGLPIDEVDIFGAMTRDWLRRVAEAKNIRAF